MSFLLSICYNTRQHNTAMSCSKRHEGGSTILIKGMIQTSKYHLFCSAQESSLWVKEKSPWLSQWSNTLSWEVPEFSRWSPSAGNWWERGSIIAQVQFLHPKVSLLVFTMQNYLFLPQTSRTRNLELPRLSPAPTPPYTQRSWLRVFGGMRGRGLESLGVWGIVA
jgi:hypothetical protein